MHKFKTLKLKSIRIAFFGTSDFAAHHLYVLLFCSTNKIAAVFTQEQQHNQKSSLSVYQIAKAYHLNVFLSRNLSKSNILCVLKKLNIDIIIVVSYGLILPKKILEIPTLGSINVHGSILPRWRGPAPIQRAIENGDLITGVSIIYMDEGIDTGKILCIKTCMISFTDTSYTLSKKLAQIGSISLLQTIENIILNKCYVIPQNALPSTYAYKLKKKESRINWKLSAIELDRKIRAFNPWPVTYFYTNKKRIKLWTAKIACTNDNIKDIIIKNNNFNKFPPGMILKTTKFGIYVVTGSGILILTVLQISGKKKTAVKDILNGYQKWFLPFSILQ